MSLDISIVATVDADVYSGNITGNLIPMWKKAGVYDALYGSDYKKASEIIDDLKSSIKKMKKDPKGFKKLNPKNGWGDYETAIEFLVEVLSACEEWPNGVIRLSI